MPIGLRSAVWGAEAGEAGAGSDVPLVTYWIVTLDPNGGTVSAGRVFVDKGGVLGEQEKPARVGYAFVGWFTASSGGTMATAATKVTKDVTYYAHWWRYGDVLADVAQVGTDESGSIVVTLTGDVNGTVEIPDNVGAVTIDLNGHSMTGGDGPAIRIVNGDSGGAVDTQGGETVRLAIVDTSDGEKGWISGNGENAGVEVAEDAAPGVTLDVEDGVGVFNGDGSEQKLKPELVGTGKVTTPKTWKTGQKVTWKAIADKGSVFAQWDGPLVEWLNLAKNERRNPSLAFVVPEGFETNMVTAVFLPLDDDGLYSLGITQTELELKEAVPDVWVTDDSQSYVTASASGLPAGLKFDAKKMMITGTPTKSGVYWVQIKAKNASGYQWAENVKVTVSGGGTEAKEPKLTRTAYHPLTVICATEGGTASGTGVYAEGKKVTIKATPAKGYVFAGWHETVNSDEGIVNSAGGAEWRSPSMSVAVPETRYVFAKFATKEDDAASLKVTVPDVTTEPDGTVGTTGTDGTRALDLGACVSSLSLPKLAVRGLPTGLKYDAKTLKVTGKATKPGVYIVAVKATNASVAKATDATAATFKITVHNFECAALPGLKPETDAYGTIRAGVKFDAGLVDCKPEDGWTVKAAGLPAGLTFAAKETKDAVYGIVPAWTVYGVPTAKAGAYTVTFTATKKGEKNQIATITLNVEALPAWTVGTFDGCVLRDDGGDNGRDGARPSQDEASAIRGIVALTVAANGKISGKLVDSDGTWTLSAAAFDEAGSPKSEAGSPVFTATVAGKNGKMAFTNNVEVSAEAFGGASRGVASGDGFAAWQNMWKTEPWKTEAKIFAEAKPLEIAVDGGTVTLKFAATGAATAAGRFVTGTDARGKDVVYSANCTATLVPDAESEGVYRLFPYFPPKAGKFDGFAAEIRLVWDGAAFSLAE